MHFDVFNGDADGIFSLHQLRLERPVPSATLITGVKRDIALLAKVVNKLNCSFSVFDISLGSNRTFLLALLDPNNSIEYFDHHFAGEVPASPLFKHTIDVSAETCTSMIINTVLKGKQVLWAICGAFGDNLHQQAVGLAKQSGLTKKRTEELRELGELFNYNGYGATENDLHFHPKDLYLSIKNFNNPFDFIGSTRILESLRTCYQNDFALAHEQKQYPAEGKNRIYFFPNAPWARRIQGVFSNMKAREQSAAAHVLLVENNDKSLRVSLRAPLDNRRDADTLCKLFPTGGGRAAAAGINSLPAAMLNDFLRKLADTYN